MKIYLTTKAKVLMHKLKEKDGDGYVDTGVKILIAIVVGALVLAGLYYMFGDVILPTLETKIREMFDYNGGGYTP